MGITFEQLPKVIGQILMEIDIIKNLLLERNITPSIHSEDLMNITQAADMLNLSKSTIYGYTCAGTIPFIKKGKRIYFSRQKLTEWVHSNEQMTISEINQTADDYILGPRKGRKHKRTG